MKQKDSEINSPKMQKRKIFLLNVAKGRTFSKKKCGDRKNILQNVTTGRKKNVAMGKITKNVTMGKITKNVAKGKNNQKCCKRIRK